MYPPPIEKTKTRYPRAQAMEIGTLLYRRLMPFCEKIEIVGSLRREKADVGDLELLYIPIMRTEQDGLFDTKQVDAAEEEINWMLKEKLIEKRLKNTGSTTWGRLNRLATHVPSGIPVDLFATDHEKWFVSLLTRTGPAAHNIHVINELAKRGLKFHAYGVIDEIRTGRKIVPRSEEEIFQLAGMKYLQPQHRKYP